MVEGSILPGFFVMAGFTLNTKRSFVLVVLCVAANAFMWRFSVFDA